MISLGLLGIVEKKVIFESNYSQTTEILIQNHFVYKLMSLKCYFKNKNNKYQIFLLSLKYI